MLNVKIESHDGATFGAYLAKASKPGAPSLVMIQEIFGVNANIVKTADAWAGHGYNVVAPDLFWRLEPGLELEPKLPADSKKAFDYYGKFDRQNGLKDLITTLAYARKIAGASGKAGSMGFCLGGYMAFEMAVHSDADANVVFYGGGMDKEMGHVGEIKKPLLIHLAGADHFITPDLQQVILNAVKDKPHIAAHVYPGVDHAFMRINGESFNAEAASLATQRTKEFLARALA